MNKKGFTLVEIIVSIAIGSIVLLIAGSMIVSAFQFFNSTTSADDNKRSCDYVIDFVRAEIVYATDVRLIPKDSALVPDYENDEDWHYFYIKDGELYRDDEKIYDRDFFNGNNLVMSAMGNGTTETNNRLDILYSLVSDSNVNEYASRDTVMFLNLSVSNEILQQGLYTAEYKNITEDEYWLFYNGKVTTPTTTTTTSSGDGTVADIINLINSRNMRGIWSSSVAINYRDGEIVWHNGYWWQRTSWDNTAEPGSYNAYCWKRLTRDYTHAIVGVGSENKMISAYQKGDIVVFKNNYYEATANKYDEYSTRVEIIQWNGVINLNNWTLIGAVGDSTAEQYMENKKYDNYTVYEYRTVLERYLPSNVDWTDPTHKNFEQYNSTKTYSDGDIVRVQSTEESGYWYLYIKKGFFNSKLAPGTSPASGWTKLDVMYDSNSYYSIGDVLWMNDGENMWVQATQNISKSYTTVEVKNIARQNDATKEFIVATQSN